MILSTLNQLFGKKKQEQLMKNRFHKHLFQKYRGIKHVMTAHGYFFFVSDIYMNLDNELKFSSTQGLIYFQNVAQDMMKYFFLFLTVSTTTLDNVRF